MQGNVVFFSKTANKQLSLLTKHKKLVIFCHAYYALYFKCFISKHVLDSANLEDACSWILLGMKKSLTYRCPCPCPWTLMWLVEHFSVPQLKQRSIIAVQKRLWTLETSYRHIFCHPFWVLQISMKVLKSASQHW